MTTKAMERKIFMNPEAFSMIRVFGSSGIDRMSAVIKESVPFNAYPEIDRRSAVVKTSVRSSGVVRTTINELWNKKLQVDKQHRLLQELKEGLTNFRGSLISIEHHRGSGGGRGIIEFATAASVRRLALQRLGPYGLQRQAVKGVVCITTKDAFLLYNPTTGDTSPWIETTTRGKHQVESIALGFDPRSKKHKVICISSYVERCFPETEEYECQVVEVLTVGDHTWTTGEPKWKKLKVSPRGFGDEVRFASCVDGPLYVDGQIHWQFRDVGVFEYFLNFHVGREDFNVTLLARRLNHELTDSSRHKDSTRHIRTMLMEVDGKVAILKSTSDDQETSSLWIRHVISKCGRHETFKWREEKVLIPYAYVCPGSSIEVLTGTDFIFIQSHDGRISYYNRKTKVSLHLRNPTSPIPDHFDWGRTIKL